MSNLTNGFGLDVANRRVFIGDTVAYNPPRYKGLRLAEVVGLTPQGFKVLPDGRIATSTILTGVALVESKETT